jgi:mating pheromone alpha-factor
LCIYTFFHLKYLLFSTQTFLLTGYNSNDRHQSFGLTSIHSNLYHSLPHDTIRFDIMRINAAIAAAIMAATVSAAALPATTDAAPAVATEAAAPMELVEIPDEDLFDIEDIEEMEKRSADPKFTWKQYRPFGLPVGRRDAEADPKFSFFKTPKFGHFSWIQYRPVGLPLGRRDAEAEADAKFTWKQYRPFGLPVGKREAEAEAEADAKFTWKQYRPFGLPVGKRDAEAEAEAEAYAEAFPDEE